MIQQGSAQKTSIDSLLLDGLPSDEYARLLPNLERVDLKYGARILEFGDAIRHVYFLNSGVISMLATVENDSTLIACIVGKEGIACPCFSVSRRRPPRQLFWAAVRR